MSRRQPAQKKSPASSNHKVSKKQKEEEQTGILSGTYPSDF
jgi:hypothetical protein